MPVCSECIEVWGFAPASRHRAQTDFAFTCPLCPDMTARKPGRDDFFSYLNENVG
jgi:hypothetical protein